MSATLAEPKVVVSAAVEQEQRDELQRLAREGDRTLSQQVRMAVREHLERRRRTNEERPRTYSKA